MNRSAAVSTLCLLFVSGMGFSGCSGGLTPVTQVTSLRILAVKADPPEVGPGEKTAISVLFADPTGDGRALDWVVVLCTPDETSGQCLEYLELLETSATEEEAQSAYSQCCVRGDTLATEDPVKEIDDSLLTTLTTAQGVLDGLDEITARQGVNVQLSFLACETGICTSTLDDSTDVASTSDLALLLPPEQSALAIKRVRISSLEPADRNQNPEMEDLTADGVAYDEDDPLIANPGQSYILAPRLEEGSIEDYVQVLDDGQEMQKTESPYFSWFGTDGSFNEAYSELTVADGEIVWTAPDVPLASEAVIFCVVWDRRGGIDWAWFTVSFT